MRQSGMMTAMAMLAGMLMLLSGCAQNTETPIRQPVVQDVTTPTTTDQDAATQGSFVNVWVVNAPGKSDLPTLGSNLANQVVAGLKPIATTGDDDGTGDSLDGMAAYQQREVTINITTGGTTPSLTGTSAGTVTASPAPAATVSTVPTQDVKPEVGVTMPVGVAMPGGVVDQQANTAGKGSVDSQKTSDISTQVMELRGELNKMQELIKAMAERLFPSPPVVNPPATQPAPSE